MLEGEALRDGERLPPKRDRPLFIIGTERSGSNLLRLILNSHGAIFVPHPPHVVRYFAPLERYYGDLSRDDRFELLVRDVVRLVRIHIHPWDTPLCEADVIRAARWRSVFGVYAALHDLALAASGKERWGCKSTFMIDHADTVLSHYPRARFLHLVRDPRDVAASSKESVFNPFHPLLTARLWLAQQRTGAALAGRLGSETLLAVRYEDLLESPERTLERICAFLGEPFSPRMLRFFETDEARRSASLSASWRNTATPIIRDNAGRFARSLSEDEIRTVERICGPLMRRYGYAPRLSGAAAEAGELAGEVPLWPRAVDQALRVRAEFRSLRQDAIHFRRWGRGLLLWEIALRRRALSIWDRLVSAERVGSTGHV